MAKKKKEKSVPEIREYYSYPWGMFTACPKCGEIKFCRGKSRRRVKCRECFLNE